jgi:hypothetical protein
MKMSRTFSDVNTVVRLVDLYMTALAVMLCNTAVQNANKKTGRFHTNKSAKI